MVNDDMNDAYYDTLGLDGELRVTLRRAMADARTFSTAVGIGIKPLEIQMLAHGLAANLSTLRDLMDLRYGTPEFMAKEDEPLEVEDFISPEDVAAFEAMQRNIERKAQRTIDEGGLRDDDV